MTYLTILGSTGSIGQSTLSVLDENPHIQVFALTAQKNIDLLFQQCEKYRPLYAVVVDHDAACLLEEKIKAAKISTMVLAGVEALVAVAEDAKVDQVMAAIVGAAGLKPTLAAAKAGKRILLANKESLVMSGALFMQAVQENQACLLPVDSEHNAIWQSLPKDYIVGTRCASVDKIILTASGGPFLKKPLHEFSTITPAQAVKHPNWSMGAKISVDSATMMNKGLEYIEAHYLFQMPPEKIEVLLHPQSLIHSMVQYKDHSILAQLGPSDMRVPISSVLGWPNRITSNTRALDFTQAMQLEFLPMDEKRFPCLTLAKQALRSGGYYPCVLNAANEVAVQQFLSGRIGYLQIYQAIETVLEKFSTNISADTIENLIAIDEAARVLTLSFIT